MNEYMLTISSYLFPARLLKSRAPPHDQSLVPGAQLEEILSHGCLCPSTSNAGWTALKEKRLIWVTFLEVHG